MENTIDILAAWREYQALPDSEWRKDFFCPETGGYLVTSWKRLEEASSKNEPEKLEIEHSMCLVFAKSGFKIRHYEDGKLQGSFDVTINNVRADLKKTRSTNNIIRYGKHAIREVNRQAELNQPGGGRYRPTEVSRPYFPANIQHFFHLARVFYKKTYQQPISGCS